MGGASELPGDLNRHRKAEPVRLPDKLWRRLRCGMGGLKMFGFTAKIRPSQPGVVA
jgi:hypothetical protein